MRSVPPNSPASGSPHRGCSCASRAARIREAALETLAELRFGRLDDARGLFVLRDDRETVYRLAPESTTELPSSWPLYLERFEVPVDEESLDGEAPVPTDPLDGLDVP